MMGRDDAIRESARSWIVAACCCFCNFTFYGISRLSGIMLVATTHAFHASRASAAVPYSLSTAVRNLAGLFVGHLGHRFGVGPVVAAGVIIASLGSGLCFFAKDMLWLSVCWGGIFGFGFGLCTCLLPLAINKNFSQHLGTASGISYSGSYLGSFIFPPVVVWLLEKFALQGTFLIISGGVLHVLIAALLLKEPKKNKKKAIPESLEDPLSTDPTKLQNLENAQPFSIGMWKQNLQRAYIDSQYSDIYKQLLFHTISCANNPCFLQDSPGIRRALENENSSERIVCSLHCEVNNHCHNLLPRTFENKLPKDTENEKELTTHNNSSRHSTSCVSLSSDIDCVHSMKCSDICLINDKESSNDSAKKLHLVPRMCFKRPSNRSLFKGNLKAKHKLKLQKLKKIIIASFLKHKTSYLKEFDQTNITLTSYKYFPPFTYPTSDKYFCSSSIQNILGRRSTICRVDNDSNNSFITSQYATESRGRFYSLPVLGTKGVINDPLMDSTKCLVFSESSYDQRTVTCSCHTLVTNKHHSCLCSSNNTCDDISCNMDVLQTDSPTIYKDNQPSLNILTLSPELLLKEKTDFKAYKRKYSSISQSTSGSSNCFLDWLYMFREPMFLIIGLTMSIQTFTVVCVVTTIEDYARDIGIPENRTHYALMALSIANLIGTLTLGTITDRGFISRHRFMSLCFLGMSLSLVAVSLLASSLFSLLLLIVIYGLLESGVIITFPLLTKQFVEGERRQAVAIASSNVLSVPTVMLVPMLIGHFRDQIGSYIGLFHLMGATSLVCSLLWIVAPSVCKKRKLKKALKLNVEKC